MTPQELWNEFTAATGVQADYEAWAFGGDPDGLLRLVLEGTKTATASAAALYALENEPLPAAGEEYSVILDSQGHAGCIIRTTRVSVVPFRDVSAEFAWREGERDRSLDSWREIHRDFFTDCMGEAGLDFTEDMDVVCEEFELVWPK